MAADHKKCSYKIRDITTWGGMGTFWVSDIWCISWRVGSHLRRGSGEGGKERSCREEGIASMDTRGVTRWDARGSDERFGLLGVWVWRWCVKPKRQVKDKIMLSSMDSQSEHALIYTVCWCPVICLDQFWHKVGAPLTFTEWMMCWKDLLFQLQREAIVDSWGSSNFHCYIITLFCEYIAMYLLIIPLVDIWFSFS